MSPPVCIDFRYVEVCSALVSFLICSIMYGFAVEMMGKLRCLSWCIFKTLGCLHYEFIFPFFISGYFHSKEYSFVFVPIGEQISPYILYLAIDQDSCHRVWIELSAIDIIYDLMKDRPIINFSAIYNKLNYIFKITENYCLLILEAGKVQSIGSIKISLKKHTR